MPGANCSIFGCPTSRRNKDISIFKVPLPNSEANKKWRSELINIITKDRVVDDALKKRIAGSNLFICEQHFSTDQFYIYPTRKSLKEGALPTLNLPKKSVAVLTSPPRSTSSIQKREECSVSPNSNSMSSVYKDFSDFVQRIVNLKLSDTWDINIQNNLVIATFISADHLLPKFEIFIDQSLSFSLRVYGWMLPKDHEIYGNVNNSFLNITFSNFVHQLKLYNLCHGISIPNTKLTNNIQKHVIPKKFNYFDYQVKLVQTNLNQDEFHRSSSCKVLVTDINPYLSCNSLNLKCVYDSNRNSSHLKEPAKLNAPIKYTSSERIKLTLQNERLKCKTA